MPCGTKRSWARCILAAASVTLVAAGCTGYAASGSTDAVRDLDFDNATVIFGGAKHQLKDGHETVENQPSKVGLYLREGPEFADVNDDGLLDAAVIFEWQPASGSVVREAYVWLGDEQQPHQVKYPITTGYRGTTKDLTTADHGFGVTMRSEPGPGEDGPTQDVVVAVEHGFPVQVKPVRSAVDRCELPEGTSPGKKVSGEKVRVEPDADAPQVAKASTFSKVQEISSERNTSKWTMVRAERDGGKPSCGWVPADAAGE